MAVLTTRERFMRMFEHKDADRIPIMDSPWGATIERWHSEGMPKDIDYIDYFDLDHISSISVDNSPRYPEKTLEVTDKYKIYTSKWGVTMKSWTHAASTPEFKDFTVIDRDSWAKAKARMTPDRDRIDWDYLKENYPKWRERGDFIIAGLWFGFDITHSWFVGTERVLINIVEDPEWLMDMFETELDLNLKLLQMVWDEGYTFDAVRWPDDMGYKLKQFFSKRTYRRILKPYHQRAIEWAHAKGIKAMLHSCGDIRPLIPEVLDIGLDCLNPIEVKAGMDPLLIKQEYGDNLVLHGGVNAVLWDKPEKIKQEMTDVIPKLMENGGYIFASDHSIPSSVSLKDFQEIIDLVKVLGSYDS